MATIDIDLYDALKAANVPDDKARAAAAALERRFAELPPQFVTNADLGVAVDRLESTISSEVARLEAKMAIQDSKISSEMSRLASEIKAVDAKIDAVEKRTDAKLQLLQWMLGLVLAISLGILWKLLR